MISFRDTIFNLFSPYDHQIDINKDADGKGTNQRYNEVVGKYIDEELIVMIDKLVDNNLLPNVAYEKFIPYLEERLGVDLYLYDTLEWRRRVLRHILNWYKIKGTITAYKLMLGMLGFDSVEITEYMDVNSLDSPITFDDTYRVFDMNKCNRCVAYGLTLTGSFEITPDIVSAIESIVKFNEPINAYLRYIKYNDNPLVYQVIEVWIDEMGDLHYSNEYDPELFLTLNADGSLNIQGPNASRYFIDNNGDLIYTYG